MIEIKIYNQKNKTHTKTLLITEIIDNAAPCHSDDHKKIHGPCTIVQWFKKNIA